MGKEIDITPAHAVAVTPGAMITQAIASGAGVEVVEKLMALHERWEAMQNRKAFDNAMAELRQKMPTIIKTQEADFGVGKAKYKFEDLASVTEVLSPIMAEVGLSFRWSTDSLPSGVAVTCIISHRDGHAETTRLASGFDTTGNKNAIQALGSAVTYLQRYTLKAAVGIAAAKDDDGAAAGNEDKPHQKAVGNSSTSEMSATFKKAAASIRAATTRAELNSVWETVKALSNEELPDDEYKALGKIADERETKLPNAAPAPKDDFPGDIDPTDSLNRQFGNAA